MYRVAIAVVLYLASLQIASARDFGNERLAAIIAQKWSKAYGLLAPYQEAPTAENDPAGFGFGYLGSVANFQISPGRGSVGQIVSFDGSNFCNPDDRRPPARPRTKVLKDYLYRFEIGFTGEFTITGASKSDVIFKLSAIDARWIDYFALDIVNSRLHTLPVNVLKTRYADAAAKGAECKAYRYGVKSVLTGDVKARFYFRKGITSDILLNISKNIQASLNFKVEAKEGESEGKPFIEFTEGDQIFAVAVDKLK